MFWFVSKKDLKKETKKIKNSFSKRDKKTTAHSKRLTALKDKVASNELKISRLEGALSVLLSKSQVSVSKKSQQVSHTIETQMIKRFRKRKKDIIISEIERLMPDSSVIELFDIIVSEKKLCSKASFYRYIKSLKSQRVKEVRLK